MNEEIARREAALAKESSQNLEKIEQVAKASGVLDDSGNVISLLEKQTSKTSDTGMQTNESQVEASGILYNSGEKAPFVEKQPEKDNTSAKAVAQKVDNAAGNDNKAQVKDASAETAHKIQEGPDKRAKAPDLSDNSNAKRREGWKEFRDKRQQFFTKKEQPLVK